MAQPPKPVAAVNAGSPGGTARDKQAARSEPELDTAPRATAPAMGGGSPAPWTQTGQSVAPTGGVPFARDDQERTLLALLRLIDRVGHPGTLSPVERAFVSGAKTMFDQLSTQCQQMLDRRPIDMARSMAKPAEKLISVGNTPQRKTRRAKPVVTQTARPSKSAHKTQRKRSAKP